MKQMNEMHISVPESLLKRVRSVLDTAKVVVDKHDSGKLSSIPFDSIAIVNLKEALDFLAFSVASTHISNYWSSDTTKETNED